MRRGAASFRVTKVGAVPYNTVDSLVSNEYYAIGIRIDSAALMSGKQIMSIMRKEIVLYNLLVARCDPCFLLFLLLVLKNTGRVYLLFLQ